ncbi:hypothetical protein [Ancylobacter sp. G4_0304]|uniref:hypothetical protein n=1 Tax=Ancylobacter sp. G4_0304 TaxID=3114289 RepID=UPI0039C6CFA5
MMGKFGRVTVSALALMVSFGALDAVSVNSGAARAQALTAAQLSTPPASASAALELLVSLINQATGNGAVTANGAVVSAVVGFLMTHFQGSPAAVGFITNALVQAASGTVPALQGVGFANLKEPILTGVKAVVDGWTQTGGAGFNLAAFQAFRDEVETMEGDYSALDDFRAIASNASKRLPKLSKKQTDDEEDGAPPDGTTVTQSNPLSRVGIPSPSTPVIIVGGFDPGAPVTFTITGENAGGVALP